MILDIHTHNVAGRANEVLAASVNNGIDRIILLGDVLRNGTLPTPNEIRKINDDTLVDVRLNPKRTRGFCFLNLANPMEFIEEEVMRCLVLPEFIGVKLEVSVNVRSRRIDPLMALLDQFDVPLLQHCWYKTVKKYPGESNPADVSNLALRFPTVKIIMAHLCGCRHRGIEDIAECPNVWVDTSGAQPEAGFIEYAVRRIGAQRLLYGSDAPCRDYGCQLAKVREAKISEADRALILGKNAEELLQW